MYCRDLEVMSSNPGLVELGVHDTDVLVVLDPKISANAHPFSWNSKLLLNMFDLNTSMIVGVY